jgi:predicted RNA binding protein YcfA (HicA-like mRNA interferase family)
VKLLRGVSADRLLRVLSGLGYEVVRQKGSHVRIRHPGPPVHKLSIPLHYPLKTGTLHAILTEVAQMRSVAIESLMEMP